MEGICKEIPSLVVRLDISKEGSGNYFYIVVVQGNYIDVSMKSSGVSLKETFSLLLDKCKNIIAVDNSDLFYCSVDIYLSSSS